MGLWAAVTTHPAQGGVVVWLFVCRPSRFYIVGVYIVLVLQEVYRLRVRLFSGKAGADMSCYGMRYRLQLGKSHHSETAICILP